MTSRLILSLLLPNFSHLTVVLPNLHQFEPNFVQLLPILGPSWPSLGAPDPLKTVIFLRFFMIFDVGPFWPQRVILASSWALLGPSWGPLGPSWGPLGALLGTLGALLGPSWAFLGPSWGILGPSWATLGLSRALLKPCCATLGLSCAILVILWTNLGPS